MPLSLPDAPRFATASERAVWQHLRDQLRPEDVLLTNVRVTDDFKDHEVDLIVLMPGSGAVVVEVKGGAVTHDGETWWQTSANGHCRRIDPIYQVRSAKYALRRYLESDPRWRDQSRGRFRWAHVLVVPHTEVDDDFARPDCPRWSIAGRRDLHDLAGRLWDVPVRQESANRVFTADDADTVIGILRGRNLPQRDVVALAAEREHVAEQLTQDQAVILAATSKLHRVEVRGGAGSGKTWLALEQTRRLARGGAKVALTCYSRGLAEFLRRTVAAWPRRHRPAYVGEFHALGVQWGAAPGTDDDSDFWERRLPNQMVDLAAELSDGHRFDAVVVAEAQDFAESWWPALLAALRDDESGGVHAFTDDGQRVFQRYGRPPVPLVPLVLDHNLRNTVQIADTFIPLTPMPMRLMGSEGPNVRFVPSPSAEALDRADDEVDALLDAGWRPEDLALLTTGSRNPEQVARQAEGQNAYWATFWDDDQVFYGHVLGFKGMERRAVVLALNESELRERSKERLYVGLSRARDTLVVVGDPEQLRAIGGDDVHRRVTGA
ncbi:nuclease-like protein [Haloactinopolyspora alba]|uniref:Nuclease-like protein n=1 Tax=Haloactinopolyspora alba TaxID=648780 RepID=A0A2P8EG58_9ACTN|nr:NERD domain-containing protein [Haloactinopolyspora alba]PSL08453.1 nuclease-like protein [Haloactinopolyspora alba]